MRVEKARQSLRLLRASLNRSLALPPMDNDSEEEVEINEDDVSQLCEQLGDLHSVLEESPTGVADHDGDVEGASLEDHSGNDEGNAGGSIVDGSLNLQCGAVSCLEESNLDEPVSSESPRVSGSVKKSFAGSLNLSESRTKIPAGPGTDSEDMSVKKKMELVRSSLQLKKLSPTDSLAASLHRGLRAIDYHQRSSASEKTPLSFSFDHLIAKSSDASDLAEKSVPQSTSEGPLTSKSTVLSICASSQKKEVNSDEQIIPLSSSEANSGSTKDNLFEVNKCLHISFTWLILRHHRPKLTIFATIRTRETLWLTSSVARMNSRRYVKGKRPRSMS